MELVRPPSQDPAAKAEQRDTLRRLVADVQRLPDQQRSALLMRELGGMAYCDLADVLEVSVPAVKSLLVRARVGLAQAEEARDMACARIRDDVIVSHDRGVRLSGLARRHMRDCPGCRAFRAEVRGVSHQFAALAPTLGPLGLLANFLGIGGGGSAAASASGGAAAGGGALAAGSSAAAGGGAIASAGALATGAGHVVTLLAAAVVTAGGAAAVQSSIAPSPPHRAHHHHVARAASAVSTPEADGAVVIPAAPVTEVPVSPAATVSTPPEPATKPRHQAADTKPATLQPTAVPLASDTPTDGSTSSSSTLDGTSTSSPPADGALSSDGSSTGSSNTGTTTGTGATGSSTSTGSADGTSSSPTATGAETSPGSPAQPTAASPEPNSGSGGTGTGQSGSAGSATIVPTGK